MKTNHFSRLVRAFLLIAFLYGSASFSQNKYQSQLNVVFEVFTTKNFQLLSPVLKQQDKKLLSDDQAIILKDIAAQISLVSKPESYRIIKTETIGYNQKITVEYQYQDKAQLHYFYFDPKGKLIRLDINTSNLKCL